MGYWNAINVNLEDLSDSFQNGLSEIYNQKSNTASMVKSMKNFDASKFESLRNSQIIRNNEDMKNWIK